jgi:hypothetical protein
MNIFQIIPRCNWNSSVQMSIEYYLAAMVMGMVGLVLIVDKELKLIQMVRPFSNQS